MSCFPCFASKKSKEEEVPVAKTKEPVSESPPPAVKNEPKPPAFAPAPTQTPAATPAPVEAKAKSKEAPENKTDQDANTVDGQNIAAQTFNFRELATATKNFRQECLLGEGGFGRVYKGTLQSNGQVVAVKQLDRNGMQGNKEFLVEVLMLSLLHHPNLVNLIGYCADGEQRLLVHEYMPFGSLEDHLFGEKKPIDWITRMKIASGAAQGLEYLHEKANPPVIYRDLKSSNILLDEELNPKLTDFGLAKLAGNKMEQAPSRVMGTYGYSAPEYERTGELTLKSDIYSFGVILLELISGRKAIDTSRPTEEQNLVNWAQPIFKDPKRFPEMADPLLKKDFPVRSLNQVVGIAAMCLQDEASVRPLITDVVAALSFLTQPQPQPQPQSTDEAGPAKDKKHKRSSSSSSSSSLSSSSSDEDEKPKGKKKGSSHGDSSESLYGIENEEESGDEADERHSRGGDDHHVHDGSSEEENED